MKLSPPPTLFPHHGNAHAKQDPHPAQGLRPLGDRDGRQGDRGHGRAHRRLGVRPVPLPTEKNVYCVVRGPFKDKDSREHFEIRTHKRLIDILQPPPRPSTRCSGSTTCRPASTSRSSSSEVMAGLLGKAGNDAGLRPRGRARRARDRDRGRPCFVTGIRRAERDGYDAVQVAFGSVREKKLTKPELGHLKKAGVGPMKHLAEFRGEAGELEVGNELKVDTVFEKGQTVKVSGVSRARASRARSSATTSTAARSRTARTTSGRRDRSAPPPTRHGCSRASAGPGRWATSAPRSAASRSSTCARREPAAGARLRSRGQGLRRGDPRGGS